MESESDTTEWLKNNNKKKAYKYHPLQFLNLFFPFVDWRQRTPLIEPQIGRAWIPE